MKLLTAAALAATGLAAIVSPGFAFAASLAPSRAASEAPAPQADAQPASPGTIRVAMLKETLPPGGKLAEHRPEGERYLFVVSGRLKVSDLATGDEQVVEAGKMAAEQPGDWHVAQALGQDPVVLYIIDRTPQPAAATAASASIPAPVPASASTGRGGGN